MEHQSILNLIVSLASVILVLVLVNIWMPNFDELLSPLSVGVLGACGVAFNFASLEHKNNI